MKQSEDRWAEILRSALSSFSRFGPASRFSKFVLTVAFEKLFESSRACRVVVFGGQRVTTSLGLVLILRKMGRKKMCAALFREAEETHTPSMVVHTGLYMRMLLLPVCRFLLCSNRPFPSSIFCDTCRRMHTAVHATHAVQKRDSFPSAKRKVGKMELHVIVLFRLFSL